MKNDLTYGEQIALAHKKAIKEKNVEAIAYYRGLLNTSASVSFETFKGSWAYDGWKKKESTKALFLEIEKEIKRFSYLS